MPAFCVTLPITGYCTMEVEADTADQAIEKAESIAANEHIETWQTHRQIATGNVCHAEINEACAEAIE